MDQPVFHTGHAHYKPSVFILITSDLPRRVDVNSAPYTPQGQILHTWIFSSGDFRIFIYIHIDCRHGTTCPGCSRYSKIWNIAHQVFKCGAKGFSPCQIEDQCQPDGVDIHLSSSSFVRVAKRNTDFTCSRAKRVGRLLARFKRVGGTSVCGSVSCSHVQNSYYHASTLVSCCKRTEGA